MIAPPLRGVAGDAADRDMRAMGDRSGPQHERELIEARLRRGIAVPDMPVQTPMETDPPIRTTRGAMIRFLLASIGPPLFALAIGLAIRFVSTNGF